MGVPHPYPEDQAQEFNGHIYRKSLILSPGPTEQWTPGIRDGDSAGCLSSNHLAHTSKTIREKLSAVLGLQLRSVPFVAIAYSSCQLPVLLFTCLYLLSICPSVHSPGLDPVFASPHTTSSATTLQPTAAARTSPETSGCWVLSPP